MAIPTAMALLSFAVVVKSFFDLKALAPDARLMIDTLFPWIQIGALDVSVAFQFDPLSAVMTLVVTGIGSLIPSLMPE